MQSAEEVRDAIARDPVVAAHYAHVNTGALHAVTLTAGRAAYVSYRVGGLVYWTRKPLWIKAGETVLTDGTTEIRTRCGNCISVSRRQPVAGVEPAAGALDDAIAPPADRGLDAFAAESSPDLGDLFGVPFGPEAFASLAPSVMQVPPELDLPFDAPAFRPFGLPLFGIPGAPGGTDSPDTDTPPLQPGTPVSSGPPPAAPFVPIADVPTGDVPATPADTTTSSGAPTSASPTSGAPTSSTMTTSAPTPSSTIGSPGAETGGASGAVPEPDAVWMLACGAAAVVRIRLLRRR